MEGIDQLGKQIETLTREACDKQPPKEVCVRGESTHVTWLYSFADGKMTRYIADAAPRNYTAGGLAAVGVLVNEFKGRPAGTGTDARKVVVFVQAGSVQAVLDEAGDRRERVGMKFKRSDSFVTVCERLNSGRNQKDFIDLLRTEIAGVYNPENVISTLRRIKFTSSSSGESSVVTGKQSMGKAVEAEIAGLDGKALDSLETVYVTIPVYSDLLDDKGKAVEATIECHLDIDLQEQKFKMRPKAGEIERVLLETDRRIMDDIGFTVNPSSSNAASSTPLVLIVRGIPN